MSVAQPYLTQPSFSGWLILCSLFLLTLIGNQAVVNAQSRILQAGSSFTSEIKPKESQLADFDLNNDELIKMTVSARGAALSMRVLTATGDSLLEVPYRQQEPLMWFFVASKRDRYRLV